MTLDDLRREHDAAMEAFEICHRQYLAFGRVVAWRSFLFEAMAAAAGRANLIEGELFKMERMEAPR